MTFLFLYQVVVLVRPRFTLRKGINLRSEVGGQGNTRLPPSLMFRLAMPAFQSEGCQGDWRTEVLLNIDFFNSGC